MTQANIYSQGYRNYTGARTGHRGAITAIRRYSLAKALGLSRKFRFKLIPIMVALLAYLPTIAFVGFAVITSIFIPDVAQSTVEDFFPSTADFFGYMNFATYTMAGYVGPLLLSDDRRDGMLGVSLASPLTRPSYLAAKGWAVLMMIAGVLLLPQLVLFFSLSTQDMGPESIGDWPIDLLEIVAGSLIIGLFYMGLSLAISSISDRRSVAWTAFFLSILVLPNFSFGLIEAGDAPFWFRLIDITGLPIELVYRILGDDNGEWKTFENSTLSLWIGWAAITLGAFAVVWFRYRRLLVRK